MDLHYLEARAGAHWSPLGHNGFKCYNNYLVNFALQIWLTSTRPRPAQKSPPGHKSRLFGNRWLPQTTYADCAGSSGDLPPPSPPAEKTTARQDQVRSVRASRLIQSDCRVYAGYRCLSLMRAFLVVN